MASTYKASGTLASAGIVSGLLIKANLGNVYNISESFTTTTDFLEGMGYSHPAGTNIVIVDSGSEVYKFDVLTGFVDLSSYVKNDDARLSDSRTPTSHTHGSITNDGKIGTTPNLIVQTGAGGTLTAKAAGTTAQFLRGDGSWATPPDNDTIYTHPSDGAGTTIAAANGKVLSSITVDSLGHTTAVGSKTLVAADIPNLNTSKLTEGTLGVARGGTGRTDGYAVGVVETRASVLTKIWTGTEAQYDAIVSPDANTIYYITED